MKTIILKAKSSSGDPYDVTFTNTGHSITVSCTCQAGIYGKLCKHKTKLLHGDVSILYDPSDAKALRKVVEWVRASDYETVLATYEAIKKEIEAVKQKEKNLRQTIELTLREGIMFKGNNP